MPPKKVDKTTNEEGEDEILFSEKIESAEVRTKIKNIYPALKKLYKNLSPLQKYTKGNIRILKSNLENLENMKNVKESRLLKNRIRLLYNRFIKNGQSLPEPLDYYIDNKSLHELSQIESKFDIDLANFDKERIHKKIVEQIKSIISTLEKFGDKEPSKNYDKYIGTEDTKLSNSILRSNLDTLEKRLEDVHEKQIQASPSKIVPKPEAKKSKRKEKSKDEDDKQAQPEPSTDEVKNTVPKPEAKKAQPSPKPEAKKSKGKEKSKDEEDTLILNSLTKMSDSELEKYNNNEELKKQFIISLFGHDIVPTDMAILVGKLNNEIRELKYKKRLGAPIRSDMQPIIISKQKEFDNGIKMIDNLVAKK